MSVGAASPQLHWSQIGETTCVGGMWLFFGLHAVVGRRVLRVLLWPVVLFYALTQPAARRASLQYLGRLQVAHPERLTDEFLDADVAHTRRNVDTILSLIGSMGSVRRLGLHRHLVLGERWQVLPAGGAPGVQDVLAPQVQQLPLRIAQRRGIEEGCVDAVVDDVRVPDAEQLGRLVGAEVRYADHCISSARLLGGCRDRARLIRKPPGDHIMDRDDVSVRRG